MFGWVGNQINERFIKPYFQKGEDKEEEENPRLNSHLDYRMNDCILNNFDVDKTRLYFRSYDRQETVKTLQDQYRKINNKELILESEEVKISPAMPLDKIITSNQKKKAFQQILEKLEHKEKIEQFEMPEEQKEIVKQVIQECNNFHQFDCIVHMQHGLGNSLQLGTTVSENTTFQQLIQELNKNSLVRGTDIEFLSTQGKLFDPTTYKESLKMLKVYQPTLHARYSYQNSLLRGNTAISVRMLQGKQLPVQVLKQATQQKVKVDVISCNFQMKRIEYNQVTNFREVSVKQFHRITLVLQLQQNQQDSQLVILEATGSLRVFLLTSDLDEIWQSVESLKKGDHIEGIHPRRSAFAIYQVLDNEKICLEQGENFYGVEVLPAHQFIANRIITHNCDAFSITAKYLGKRPKQEEVRFYRNDPISKHFGEKVCMVGGLKLNNRQTFGDYQLDQFGIIYVLEGEGQAQEHREHVISEWRKQCVNRDKTDPDKLQVFTRKLQQQYFGIYCQRIVSSSQIESLCQENPHALVNVLVALRMHFQLLNYHLNKQPKYVSKEQQIYKQQEKVPRSKKDEQKLKKAIAAGQERKEKKMKPSEVTAIFLYTSNRFYRDLSAYLRDKYVMDIPEQEEKWLPLVGWIARSTQRTQPYRGVTYRGVGNIDLRKALNLDKQHPQLNGKAGQFRDKFIMFNSFTSTSLDEKVACRFLQKDSSSNSLLTVKVNRGYQIEKYSCYDSEKQILILPFTYFLIKSYNLQSSPQTAELQEIPMPRSNAPRLIFWVDDNPDSNEKLVQHFEHKLIEVVQVTSTQIMRVILQNFFWIFKMLGKKIVIISDMVRMEGQYKNYTAGIDLFQYIFNDFGLSNKAIIYATDKKRAQQNLRQKGVLDGNWVITTQTHEIIYEVENQFSQM